MSTLHRVIAIPILTYRTRKLVRFFFSKMLNALHYFLLSLYTALLRRPHMVQHFKMVLRMLTTRTCQWRIRCQPTNLWNLSSENYAFPLSKQNMIHLTATHFCIFNVTLRMLESSLCNSFFQFQQFNNFKLTSAIAMIRLVKFKPF